MTFLGSEWFGPTWKHNKNKTLIVKSLSASLHCEKSIYLSFGFFFNKNQQNYCPAEFTTYMYLYVKSTEIDDFKFTLIILKMYFFLSCRNIKDC